MHYRATSLTSDVPQTSCSALVMMIELRDPSCHSMMMPFKKNAFGHLIEGLVQWPSDRYFLYPALIVFLSFSPSFSHILSLSWLFSSHFIYSVYYCYSTMSAQSTSEPQSLHTAPDLLLVWAALYFLWYLNWSLSDLEWLIRKMSVWEEIEDA